MTPQRVSLGVILAITLAATSAATSVSAAPVGPLAGLSALETTMTLPVFGLRDHPLMYGGNWREHQRQWDAFEGTNARSSCARFRGYDRATHSYVNRNGRRVACR